MKLRSKHTDITLGLGGRARIWTSHLVDNAVNIGLAIGERNIDATTHLSVADARELSAALLACADFYEAQCEIEAAVSP